METEAERTITTIRGDLWREYESTGSQAALNALVTQYQPIVERVARRMCGALPRTVDRADLASYGVFGLIDAIEKFDRSRHARFEAYAVSRIRGSIIDELRSVDWVPRSVRAKAKSVERSSAQLTAALGREPIDAEVAAVLGISEHALSRNLQQISYAAVVSLDEQLARSWVHGGESTTLVEILQDRGEGPGMALESEERRCLVADAISGLDRRERTVIALRYNEEQTMTTIAQRLGLTVSRVCQIHTQAICRLRSQLRSPLLEAA